MTTRIRHIYPTADFPSLQQTPGASIPLRWLESLVQDIRNRIMVGAVSEEDKARVMREADSAQVWGTEHLRVTYTDELTPIEQLQLDLENATKGLFSLRSLYDDKGMLRVDSDGKLSAEVAQKLREVIWANYVKDSSASQQGTQPDTTPILVIDKNDPIEVKVDRKAQFLEYVKNAGWKLPGNERELYNDSKNSGLFTISEAEEWLNAVPGSIENVVKNNLFG